MTARYEPLSASTQTARSLARSVNCAAVEKARVRISNVTITPAGKPENHDDPLYYIRDGIVVVPKNAVIPAGFWI